MRILSISFISILILITCAFAQPDTLWTNTFGGSSRDEGGSVHQTTDGGYIIAGNTWSYGPGYQDVYLIKTDANGNEDWYQAYGGTGNELGFDAQQTIDGGYIISGSTLSFGAGGVDVYLIKTDASGTEQWSQTFGGTSYERGRSVQQTSDGGYIIGGYTESYGGGDYDTYLIKTDASGNELWSQTFGGSGADFGYSVQQTSDRGYIIAGWTESFGAGEQDVYLIKTDSSGTEQWSQTFGGSSGDYGWSVQQTADGGYVIAACTYSYGAGSFDVYLIKTDASGNEVWSQTFGGSEDDRSYGVQQTSDNGYIIAGYTMSYGAGSIDVYLIKTDESGNEVWTQTYGGSSEELGFCVQQTTDGCYIITGSTNSYGVGNYDVWLIRLDSETGVIELDEPQPITYSLLPAYPNPFNPSTLIRFEMPVAGEVQVQVFDLQGNVVATLADGWQTPGSYQVPFNASHLSSGIYLTRLTAGDFTQTQKLVLLK